MARKCTSFNRQSRRQGWIGASLLAFLFLLLTSTPPAYAAGSTANAQVTVNLHQTLSTLSRLALGVNDAVWDGNLLDSQLPNLLHNAGVKVMRYPGGSTADVYHWQTNTTEPGQGYANPNNTFDAFMSVVQATGATPIITVNYGSGTPQEAAAWVQYANITKHYHIKYWEIGNELYGNGSYGANWEYDLHAQKGPAAYANNSLQFIQAMKAVDPSIKIGAVLTAPGNWPDGVIAPGDTLDWNHTVLSILGENVDFAAVHWYAQGPTGESDAGLLAAPANGESTSVSYTPSIPSMVSTLRSLFAQYTGAKASREQIMVTETNSVSYNTGKQTVSLVNALFLAENELTWLENGVANVDWWDVHNGASGGNNNSSSLYGSAQYGDYGILSNGSCAGAGNCEPAAETPFPAYYGLQIVSKVIGEGGQIVATSSSQGLVNAFAVKREDGSVVVLLINTDPSTTYTVTLSGLHHAGDATVYSYGENSTSVTATNEDGDNASVQVIAPYSLTAVVLSSKGN